MPKYNRKLLKGFFRMIRKWSSSLKSNPTSPLTEKLNIVFIGLLALVSTILAILTFNQQQEIKGMSSLLYKQDTLIHKQDTLINYLVILSNQNKIMISKLDTSQKYLLDQLNTLKYQTKSSLYSTKPLIGFKEGEGLKILKLQEKDYYELVLELKNSGFRPAKNLKLKGFWAEIINNKVIKKIDYNPITSEEYILPNSTKTILSDPTLFTESEMKEFDSLFLVLSIKYIDPFINTEEKVDLFCKQQRRSSGQIVLYEVTGNDLKLLKDYLHNESL